MLSRSISAIAALRLVNSSAGVLAPLSAATTACVTFSIDINTFTSRSGDFISWSGVAA